MKIKNLLILAAAFIALIFVACDDDLSEIGNSIQPGGDGIYAVGDTIPITASTYSFEDSVYARTIFGLLGEYDDPTFGKIKSDYLCEFRCPDDTIFEKNTFAIDSMFLAVYYSSFSGDTTSLIGLSSYEVVNSLKANFFTNVDPSKYYDPNKMLGQSVFTIQSSPLDSSLTASTGTRIRVVKTKLNDELSNRFFKQLEQNYDTFLSTDKFNEFFKGMYITTTFGSGSLVEVDYTELRIHYRSTVRNVANTEDSIVKRTVAMDVTPEVIQMNHVENKFPSGIVGPSPEKAYLRAPAGVYTELQIPLKKILEKAKEKYGENYTINAANLKIKGHTEAEEGFTASKPSRVLLINRDSLPNFFKDRKYKSGEKTYTVITRDATTNTYNFSNLATIINHYADHYKDAATIPDLYYLMIPIEYTQEQQYVNGQYVWVMTDIYNFMKPVSAILRTDEPNMQMPLVYSSYSSRD
ncbi:MAG: DUF4270 domain-containing protein [Dysgonomonas sp.]|nr:DUF4270 domain-containing protein [Dysgonomonas sp.]